MLKLLSAALAAALVAAPALAAPVTKAAPGVAKVHVGDLDPTRVADAQRLDRRAKEAAFIACGGYEGSVRTMKQVVKRSDCYAETLAQARAQVGVTRVAAR